MRPPQSERIRADVGIRPYGLRFSMLLREPHRRLALSAFIFPPPAAQGAEADYMIDSPE